MVERLDCTGLACPEPVLRTKAALEKLGEGVLTVRVDNPASRDNVERFARSQGCTARATEAGPGIWDVEIVKGYQCSVEAQEARATQPAAPVFLVLSDVIGPEPELGKILMKSFLGTVAQADPRPARMLFLNRGVHLTTEGSSVLDVIREIEAAGVEVFSCGTCLEFFGKREALRVGRVTSMYDTVETLTGPYRVTTIT
ncbi:sulfurtransferase-like selenium metabolism protein YedF [Deferrisoma sp.]